MGNIKNAVGQAMELTRSVTLSLRNNLFNLMILFIYLKLTNQIDWAWIWITAPVWASPSAVVAVLAFSAMMAISAVVFTTALLWAVAAACKLIDFAMNCRNKNLDR